MEPEDQLGAGKVQLVVAPIDVYATRVQHRPHSAVEDVDPVFSDDVSKVSHLVVYQAKTAGSHSRKKSACSNPIALSISISFITKVRFMTEAPWLIMLTLISPRARNSLAATPGVNLRLSPTTQTMALPGSTLTSPMCLRSRRMASSRSVLSRVIETEVSEVVTTSIEVWCRSKTSKMVLKNPCAMIIRAEATFIMVTPRFT